ncbi:MAG: phosphoribosylformylglycinamidine synthase [Spartobacteria bacterium]|nr:phosphoribosylformylglycinamidine synthase [Spartobacteria bacterium]
MAFRLEMGLKDGVPDARGNAVAGRIKGILDLNVTRCITRDVYKLDVQLTDAELDKLQRVIMDPVICVEARGRMAAPDTFDWLIEVGFKAGVTDNVGRTARALTEDVVERKLDAEEGIYTSVQYFISGEGFTRDDAMEIGRQVLANALIHSIDVYSPDEWAEEPIDRHIPQMPPVKLDVKTYDLSGSDEDLMRISSEGILSLTLEEMHAIRAYFMRDEVRAAREKINLPIWPTDVELEALAQTWSEHCSHKIFAANVHYKDEETGAEEDISSLFKTFIRDSTEDIRKRIDWLVSVFVDNAGVIKVNDHLNVAFKCETHNSPSALDPYGGAITGIVGCNRDPMGTGMGAELLANTWGYCLGSPFYDGDVPQGLFHPRIIRDGVHHGVIDGGNQSGIPYARGFERFDERFIGKPLVYCGTLGLMPKEINGQPSEHKEVHPGDFVVMTGGRIGKDGIHGATFSSEELRQESPAQAVQIGDPITQRKLYEFTIEARDLGLFRAITDNGAGGLSSSAGEMAEMSGGMVMDLSAAPLKYQGLQPWEIYLSEAQERMTLAVQPENIDAFLALARQRDVEASVMGTFTDSGEMILKYGERIVARIDMDFLHDGAPRLHIPAVWNKPETEEPARAAAGTLGDILTNMIGRLNVCSGEYKSRMYDHEVKGRSIVKPFVGKYSDIPSDATVLLAEYGSREGIAVTDGINPFYSDLDTYDMATSVFDEAVRKLVAVGGTVDRIAALDNFCWPDPVQSDKTPDGPYKMAQLVRACKALYDITTAYNMPLVSGKDSMKNDSVRGGRKISIPPTLLISTMGKVNDIAKALNLSFQKPGDKIYVIGWTKKELGASEYYRLLAEEQGCPMQYGGQVPQVDMAYAIDLYRKVEQIIADELLTSAHSPSMGGLALGLAKCSLAGDLGAKIDLTKVPSQETLTADEMLFSESNSRFIVTCPVERAEELEKRLAEYPCACIGQVVSDKQLVVDDVLTCDLESLRTRFKATLYGV